MALVRNKLTLPGGDPALTRVSVEVELVAPAGAFHGNPQETEILGRTRVQPDGSGVWQLDLTPNIDITPSDTFYQVVEKVGAVTKVLLFQVPTFITFTGGSRTTNSVTLTGLPADHRLEAGDSITVDAADNTYDGTFVVGSALTTSIIYPQTAADDVSSGSGSITKAVWDLADLLLPESLIPGGVPGDFTVGSDLSVGGSIIGIRNPSVTMFPQSLNNIGLASDTITPDATIKRIVNTTGAGITLTSTPTIPNPTVSVEHLLILLNTGAQPVTLQDGSTFNLRLRAATRVLNQGDTLMLVWSTSLSDWCEVAYGTG